MSTSVVRIHCINFVKINQLIIHMRFKKSFKNFLTSVRSHCEDGVSMARLQGHLTSFRDPIKAIENGHLLSKTSTDFSGQTQTESPDLKLEHFIGGKL